MKKLLLILLACFIGISSMLQSIPAYADNTCTVSGTVKDANGSPIVGALVLFIDYDTHAVIASGVTNTEGRYSVIVSLGAYFTWQVSAVGYVQMQSAIGECFGEGTTTAEFNFVLQEDPTE